MKATELYVSVAQFSKLDWVVRIRVCRVKSLAMPI